MEWSGIVVFGGSILAVGVSFAAVLLRGRARQVALVVVAGLLAAVALAMAAYTFATEGYTNNGDTVWEVANAPRRVLLPVAIVLTAAGAAYAVRLRRGTRAGAIAAVTVLSLLVDYVAVVSTVE